MNNQLSVTNDLSSAIPWHQNPKLILFLKKATALGLIFFSFYHIFASIQDILFILPKLSFIANPSLSETLYLNLLKKAIFISTSLFIDSFYGFSLLIKPTGATKIIHIVLGVILFLVSNFIFSLSAIDQLLFQIEFLPLT